jgi:hypothetical protein
MADRVPSHGAQSRAAITFWTGIMDTQLDWITSSLAALSRSTSFALEELDGGSGVVNSSIAGAAAALAVAIAMTLYFRTGYRTFRDIMKHGFAVLAVLGLLVFVAFDMRAAAFDYLGINPARPAVEFEIRVPAAIAQAAIADTQIELHTDRNQAIARMQQQLASTTDGRGVLRGSVPLQFRTTDRTVILNLPGHAQHLFKLRLAANPSRNSSFGPWHLPDQVVSARAAKPAAAPNDAYAIRYRVI